MFGGYASAPWRRGGSFYGSSDSFLFRLLPQHAVFFASGANDNFQWCGYQFRELPNGFGFGGRVRSLFLRRLSVLCGKEYAARCHVRSLGGCQRALKQQQSTRLTDSTWHVHALAAVQQLEWQRRAAAR